MLTPIFTGRVLPGGLLVIDHAKDYARHVRSLHGRFVEVIVRKQHVQRSPQANRAKIWAETSVEYQRKREARDTRELVQELVASLKYYLRSLEAEMRLSH